MVHSFVYARLLRAALGFCCFLASRQNYDG